jgi:uncharacterized delta-60 repeat protein
MTKNPPGSNKIALQPDGKIVYAYFEPTGANALARLNADGSPDNTFFMKPVPGGISDFMIMTDGKILVGVNESSYENKEVNGLIRLSTDGSYDQTFFPPSASSTFGWQGILVQSDNKILGLSGFGLQRLNLNGTADNTFKPSENLFGKPAVIQLDGKIIVVSLYSNAVFTRLNSNGTVDASFNTGTGVSGVAVATLLLDNKILIAGPFYTYNDVPRYGLARLNANGTLDNSFIPGTNLGDNIYNAAIQPDGKILIVGSFSTYDGVSRVNIARINANGSLDNSFNASLQGAVDVKIAASRIIVATSATMVALKLDGSTDLTFRQRTGFEGTPEALAVQSDGNIYVSGSFTSFNSAPVKHLIRLAPDGSFSHNFTPGDGANGAISGLIVQPDDKILLRGSFFNYNNLARHGIARIHADGQLDETFDPGTGTDGSVSSFALQQDGKIIVQGSFTSYNGTPISGGIVRLTTTGQLDPTLDIKPITYNVPEYDPETGEPTGNTQDIPTNVSLVALMPDNKLTLFGSFDKYNGVPKKGLIRIRDDGSIDESFDSGASATNVQPIYDPVTGEQTGTTDVPGNISSMAVQPDGKILIIGYFDKYKGIPMPGMARINSNGSLDTDFDPASDVSGISKIVILSDGKILIIGTFTSYNGTNVNGIARLNEDGSLDTTFNPGSGANGAINVTAEQPDGKLLIAGTFTTYYGIVRNGIARVFLAVEKGCTDFVVQQNELPVAQLGEEFSEAFTPAGGTVPYTYTIISGTLPEGFTLLADGLLMGTPEAVDTTEFVLEVSDAKECVITKSYTLKVSNENCAEIVLSPVTMPEALPDKTYSQSLTAIGGEAPYLFKLANADLPQGFKFSAEGRIFGTTTILGSYQLDVEVRDARNCISSTTITLPVGESCSSFLFSESALALPVEGEVYKEALEVEGGKKPYIFSIFDEALPEGLMLTADGRIIGVPLAPGSSTFSIRVRDINNCIATRSFTTCIKPIVEISPSLSNDGESYALVSGSSTGNQWFKNGEPIPGATDQVLNIGSIGSGSYAVQVTINGCTGISQESIITGNEEEIYKKSVHIFPSPATDVINIFYYPNDVIKGVDVSIVNSIGDEVFKDIPLRFSENSWSITLAVNALSPGHYFIKIKDGKNWKTERFVKM